MFTLCGLILEARENLFQNFWSPFSISFYFSSERNKKNANRLNGPCPTWTPTREAFISRVCQRSGNGGPQTCLLAACGVAQRGAQHDPSSPTQTQDPRGADDAKLPQARPRQAGSRGGGEIKAGYLAGRP